MTTPFFSILDALDGVLASNVDEIDYAQTVQPLLDEPAAKKYFFEKLSNPAWLRVLSAAGVFSRPPHVDGAQSGEIQRWYPSEMLARLAKEAPEAVGQALQEVPDTDNPHVHADIVRALEHSPVGVVRLYVPRIRGWLRSDYSSPDLETVGRLASRLLHDGYNGDAIALFGAMLTFTGPRDATGRIGLRSHMNPWQFEELVETRLLPLASDHHGVLDFLISLLHEAVLLSARDNTRPNDFSYIWLPYVGSSGDHLQGIRSVLTSAVVRGARTSIKQGREDVGSVVQSLDCRGWDVFRRISLHLLVGSDALDEVIERLCSPDYFESIGLRREYTELLQDSFEKIPQSARKSILHLINRGPEPTALSRRAESFLESGQSLEEIQRELSEKWRRDWLAVIADSLPAEEAEELERLSRKHGPPRDISTPYETSEVWVGPTSPVSDEDLADMELDSLLSYLDEFQDEPGFRKPSRQGLARSLKGLVLSDPLRLSSNAPKFGALGPEYLHWFLMGLADAIPKEPSDSIAFDWPAVVTLCEDIAKESIEAPSSGTEWSSTRGSVANLLAAGLDGDALPMDLGPRVLRVLSLLTHDPNPRPEEEQQDWEDPHHPYQTAINSVRSRALETVIRYALWLHRNSQPEESNWAALDPKLEQILQTHLDTTQEESLAVRSIYGRWYPWLLLLDKEWTENHVSEIFPADREAVQYWRAAFETYLMFCPAYDAVLSSIESEYRRAVAELRDLAADKEHRRSDSVPSKLAAHVMTFYLRGHLQLSGIVSTFFEHSPQALRKEAIAYVGHHLRKNKELSEQTAERSLQLWEWRLEILRSLPDEGRQEELTAFGAWFSCEALDPERSLKNMLETLKLGAKLTYEARAVLERTAQLIEWSPELPAKIIGAIAARPADLPSPSLWTKEMHAALAKLLEFESTRAMAVEVLDNLGRAGFVEFRDLAVHA